MNLQQTILIDIAKTLDVCCNTHLYQNLSDREILKAIADKPYCWKLIADKSPKSMIESQKNVILNTLEDQFNIQFPNTLRKLLLSNSFCTFEEIEAAIDLIKF